MMKRKLISQVVAIVVTATSLSAFAADNSFYAGAAIGQSKADVEETADVTVADDSDTAWKLYAGYDVNKNLAVELAYYDLGAVKTEALGIPVSVDIDGVSLSALGKFSVNDSVDLFGRLGFAKVSGEAKANGVTAEGDDSDIVLGLGLGYSVNNSLSVRAEWERINTEDKFSILTAGVSYQF